MKKMTCGQLGGACDLEFEADTFEEMAEKSRSHAMEMVRKGDQPHLRAMEKMREMMQDPEALQDWMRDKRREFNALPSWG